MPNNDRYFGSELVQTANVLVATQDNITAAGSTQATATVLNNPAGIYNVTTTPAGTGVILPPSQAGAQVVVANNGANALLIYPAVGEKINGLAANAGFSAAIGVVTIFYCSTAGSWFTK